MRARVLLLPLFRDLRLTTDGAALDATPLVQDLDIPGFVGLLPQCESIWLITLTEGRTSGFQWNVVLRSGFTRQWESSAIKLGPSLTTNINTNGSVVHTPYSTVTSFSLESRLQLTWNNTTAGAFDSGRVSAVLACKTYGT